MEGFFESLTCKLGEDFSYNDNSRNIAIDLEDHSKVLWSRTKHNNYIAKMPMPLVDFFTHYYNAIKTNQAFTFTESDIATSEHSVFFRVYQRILEKLFFDYCLINGLNFCDYVIEKEIHFYENFRNVSFDYADSMNLFYFVMLLSLDDGDAHNVDCSLFGEEKDIVANGLPLLIPHAPHTYFHLSDKTAPAMIVKVQGA